MKSFKKLLIVVSILFFTISSHAQNPVNWTSKQLIEPTELANEINTKKDIPFIISVGPGAVIPNSVHTGMASEKEGQDKLKEQLSSLPKDQEDCYLLWLLSIRTLP